MKKHHLFPIVLSALTLSWHVDTLAATYIRYDAHSPQGKKALVSMQKAFVKLKALNCNKTMSWYYQSAMHGVPNPGQEGNLTSNPLCPSFIVNTAPKPSWSKCASHDRSGPPSDIHFLPWHRLYVENFEKIIRKYSGDPKFALPYWDYEKTPILPDRFQVKAKGSLYEPARLDSLNKGLRIVNSATQTIKQENQALTDIFDYATYNSQINKGLHDFLHDYIGGTTTSYNKVYNQEISAGLMGNVASAAFDPIFWLHHSNVDRLWQKWMADHPGQNVTLEQLNNVKWPYMFFKDNGLAINYTMEQVLAAINKPSYIYDKQLVTRSKAKVATQRLVEHTIMSTPLSAVVTQTESAHIALNLTDDKLLLVTQALNERIILALDTHYAGKPKGRYEVYVNLPENMLTTSTEAQAYFAGAISFFVNDPTGKGGDRSFRYDITDELATSKQSLKTIHLTVVKTMGSEDGSVAIKNAELLYLN
ncbi:tyrosinase family protein [Crenothrix polyspora]|uniref:Putative Tyrosinase family protein n=1 Tax=Crenothrix polyspora TaxID=360316 RepID=A0A1R4H6E4_9GAMM|nr:tyrosinase family protein [Crenothrix polyspora]SJM91430.1 putative Tyrosinase family protein [Crenothrix polyspora]